MSTFERKLNELKDKLQHTQLELSADLFNEQLIITVTILLEKWTTIHGKVLRQKSRAIWLAYGDSNTKFFHATLKARQARNRISFIFIEHGIQLHEPALIQKEFIGFFQNLLGKAAVEIPCLDPTISRDRPSDKAPGIDGFPAEFFKQYWHLIVEWGFLRMVLLEYGMPGKFVNLIMECVSIVSYSLLFNGGLTPRFQGERGLRQVDPMSPYLFVLVMEYLNRSLKQLRHNPDFNYYRRCSKLETIHICFADDLIIRCRADPISVKLMLQQFHHFYAVSVLKANLEKSSLYVAGISRQLKEQLLNEMQFLEGEIPFKFLKFLFPQR
ncbi:PREDICTED: uncharacterized protein LOC109216136 [Nicotiana attenuata]|uniref:uncharacterized protein LOC109216136 n=1 Tax=Nicotiana attenuata TaxID=49451 RepID=UPI000904F244|nr:PREDICTED: uncharacterized protein LOC109216136 [Nicotiana attenuata]